MRAMWKGSIAFGLVSVPVKVYAATEEKDVRFHQVHAADGGRISMVRRCQVDGEEVAYQDLAKAYETSDGRTVVMSDEDFENLPVPGSKELEVVEFVPSDQVDPVLFDKSYYLEPDKSALKPYVLLREALGRTDRTAVLKVVLRKRTQLAALRVRGDVLLLQTMRWPDEVRSADFEVLDADVSVKESESAMADMLVESLATDFDPTAFNDEYREALLAVIDGKVATGQATAPVDASGGIAQDGAAVLDLMEALRASVERSKAERAAQDQPAEQAESEVEAVPAAAAPRATRARSTAKPVGEKAGAQSEPRSRKTTAKKPAKKPAPTTRSA
ncbi:MAG TPA: Ku protein [Candidatus Nanopelagicales bacterium]